MIKYFKGLKNYNYLKRFIKNNLNYKQKFYSPQISYQNKVNIFNDIFTKINKNINNITLEDCENLVEFYNDLNLNNFEITNHNDIFNLYNITYFLTKKTNNFDHFYNCLVLADNLFQDKEDLWKLILSKYINFTGANILEKDILKYSKFINIINDNTEDNGTDVYYDKIFEIFSQNYNKFNKLDLINWYSEIIYYDNDNVEFGEVFNHFYFNLHKLDSEETLKFFKFINNNINFENNINVNSLEKKVIDLCKNNKLKNNLQIELFLEWININNELEDIWSIISDFIQKNYDYLNIKEKINILKIFSISKRGDDDFWNYVLYDFTNNFSKLNNDNLIDIINCVKISNFNKYDISQMINHIFKDNISNLNIKDIIKVIELIRSEKKYTEEEEEYIELEIKKRWKFLNNKIKYKIYEIYRLTENKNKNQENEKNNDYVEEDEIIDINSYYLKECFEELQNLN